MILTKPICQHFASKKDKINKRFVYLRQVVFLQQLSRGQYIMITKQFFVFSNEFMLEKAFAEKQTCFHRLSKYFNATNKNCDKILNDIVVALMASHQNFLNDRLEIKVKI